MIMPAKTSTADLADIKVDKYWHLVRETLAKVFKVDAKNADAFERDVEKSKPEEQLLFYHLDPLSIAAEIANQEPTDAQFGQYNKLRDKVYK